MTGSSWQFKEKILKVLNAINGINQARIVVGVSGGPDSTALLHFLSSLSHQLHLQLSAFYLDHGIRAQEEIAGEINLIKKLCEKLNVELCCEHLPAGMLENRTLRQHRSIEMAARERRYYLLDRHAKLTKSDFIALGHTLDDNIETILMRFFQGSGAAGLKGIPFRRGRIIRPLILCTKAEVLEYLAANKLDYSTDSTNLQNLYLRNKIRNQLLPLITEFFPGFRKSILSFSRKMHYQENFIRKEAARQIKIVPVEEGFRISLRQFEKLPVALKISVIFSLYNRITGNNGKVLPFRFIKPLLKNELTSRIPIKGYGFKASKKDNCLFFNSDIVYNRKKGYLIVNEILKNTTIKNGGLKFQIMCDNTGVEGERKYFSELVLKSDLIELPLIIRSKKEGDNINLGTFTKSLKKLFNEWKVPEKIRGILPLVADRSGLIGIMGRTFGYKNIVIKAHNNIGKCEKTVKIIINEYGVN